MKTATLHKIHNDIKKAKVDFDVKFFNCFNARFFDSERS